MHVWNELYPEDSMYEHDPAKCAEYACMDECSARDGNKIHILTGMTTGSSFIGMVHILRSEKINVEQKMSSISCYIQKQMEKKNGCGYNKNSGGHGIDSSFLTDVKKILSTQQIYSHCSMVSVGCIPSIKSKQVQVGVKQLSSFDASTVVDQLTTLATCTNKGGKSQLSEEDTARIGRQMVSSTCHFTSNQTRSIQRLTQAFSAFLLRQGTIRGEEIQSVIHSLGKIDDGQNNMLDVNSLMICFEDYVNKAAAGKCGVPIKFYVDSFTKKRIARDWLNCYYPHCPPESRKPKGRRHCGIY